MLPALARIADNTPDDLKRVQARVFQLTFLIALPCSILLFLLAAPIAHIIYGARAFRVASSLANIRSGNCPDPYCDDSLSIFCPQNKAGIWTWFLTGTVVLNTVGCLLLVPLTRHFFTIRASAQRFPFLTAECATVFCAFWLLRLQTFEKGAFSYLARTFFACGGMALAIWLTRDLFVVIPAGFRF